MGNSTSYDDIQRIRRFQHGDKQAFSELFALYKNAVFFFGMQRYHHDEEQAEQLVYSVFSYVYRQIHKIKEADVFSIWLYQIAYRYGNSNEGNHQIQHQNVFPDYCTVIDEANVSPLNPDELNKSMNLLYAAINRMSDNLRIMGYLRYYETYSMKELHTITDLPESQMDMQLKAFCQFLQTALAQAGFAETACVRMLATPNLVLYYHAFMQDYESGCDVVIDDIYRYMANEKSGNYRALFLRLSRFIKAMLILLPLLCLPFLGQLQIGQVDNLETAQFTEVVYAQEWTYEPVQLHVKTSDEDYDALYVNGTPSLIIPVNGTYELQMLKNGVVLDTRTIQIDCIDRDSPIVINEDVQNGIMTLWVEDEGSGIDDEEIVFFVDHRKHEVQFDEIEKSIKIELQFEGDQRLQIADKLGNTRIIDIPVKR